MGIRKSKKDIVKMLLNKDLEEKEEEELIQLLVDQPLAVDIDKQEKETLSFGDRLADKFSDVFGSWTFILCFTIFIFLWVLLNVYTALLWKKSADPYPFILLNLFLSCIASLQAPIIMMSQNRQSKKDSLRNKNDYHVDLKSELILETLHEQMESIAKNQKKILSHIKDPELEVKLYTEEEIEEIVSKKVAKEILKIEKAKGKETN